MNNEPDSNLIDELVKEYNNNKYLELLKKITSLQIKYPKSIFLYNLLGVLNYNLGNYDNAILNYNKINELENFNANAYYNLGIVYKKINKTNLAIKNYLKCIKTNPR